MSTPINDHTTHDTIDPAGARAGSTWTGAAVPQRVAAGLDELYRQICRLSERVPARGDDLGWAVRARTLAVNQARQAGWWGVLAQASSGDPTVPYVYARAAWIVREKARRDARFWRETAQDYDARAQQRPTSDAAGALSNWRELGVTG